MAKMRMRMATSSAPLSPTAHAVFVVVLHRADFVRLLLRLDESVGRVQRVRRGHVLTSAEDDATEALLARVVDDVVKQSTRQALPADGGCYAHSAHLGVVIVHSVEPNHALYHFSLALLSF